MSRRSGLTLLELLAVVVIFSLLLGFTVAILQGANQDLGVNASANHVVALLRAAHERARSESSPAWVLLDPAENTVRTLVKETVGEWHLEEGEGTGAFGRDARISGGTAVPGRVGKGVLLGASGSISGGEVPVYEPGQGVSIELWYLRRSGRVRALLASVGNLVEIASEPDGRVSAKAGALSIGSGTNRVPLEAWCRLQFVHSGREARLSLNGREVARGAGVLDWPGPLPFTVGGQGFAGIVDEIRLGLVIPRNSYTLPSEVSFEFGPAGTAAATSGTKAQEVVVGFDSEGRLDPPRALEFTLKSSAASVPIRISPAGTLQR
jgi:prepilin-type N-terminal cleavage/methylation domain-containing protein